MYWHHVSQWFRPTLMSELVHVQYLFLTLAFQTLFKNPFRHRFASLECLAVHQILWVRPRNRFTSETLGLGFETCSRLFIMLAILAFVLGEDSPPCQHHYEQPSKIPTFSKKFNCCIVFLSSLSTPVACSWPWYRCWIEREIVGSVVAMVT